MSHPSRFLILMLMFLFVSAFTVCPAIADNSNQLDWTIVRNEFGSMLGYGDDYNRLTGEQKREIDCSIQDVLGLRHDSPEKLYQELLNEVGASLGYGNDFDKLTPEQKNDVYFFIKATQLISDGKKLARSEQARYDKLCEKINQVEQEKTDRIYNWITWFWEHVYPPIVILIGIILIVIKIMGYYAGVPVEVPIEIVIVPC